MFSEPEQSERVASCPNTFLRSSLLVLVNGSRFVRFALFFTDLITNTRGCCLEQEGNRMTDLYIIVLSSVWMYNYCLL